MDDGNQAFKKNLKKVDLDDEYLKSHLVSIATDGASVMIGRDTGLIARLNKYFLSLNSVYCLHTRCSWQYMTP